MIHGPYVLTICTKVTSFTAKHCSEKLTSLIRLYVQVLHVHNQRAQDIYESTHTSTSGCSLPLFVIRQSNIGDYSQLPISTHSYPCTTMRPWLNITTYIKKTQTFENYDKATGLDFECRTHYGLGRSFTKLSYQACIGRPPADSQCHTSGSIAIQTSPASNYVMRHQSIYSVSRITYIYLPGWPADPPRRLLARCFWQSTRPCYQQLQERIEMTAGARERRCTSSLKIFRVYNDVTKSTIIIYARALAWG